MKEHTVAAHCPCCATDADLLHMLLPQPQCHSTFAVASTSTWPVLLCVCAAPADLRNLGCHARTDPFALALYTRHHHRRRRHRRRLCFSVPANECTIRRWCIWCYFCYSYMKPPRVPQMNKMDLNEWQSIRGKNAFPESLQPFCSFH